MVVKGSYIFDRTGRTLILRGVNLGESSKLPATPEEAAAQGPGSLDNPAEVSFTGRPFPLEEAEEHFNRLASWGFTFIRFIVTWEALEHAGPGIYDEDYLAYLRKLLITAEKNGISVYMDPHQDVWSRWTGGDGAPAWTLEALGMDLSRLDETGAAVTRQHYSELRNGKPYPRMIWPVNYSRYAAATMFTLFFAGNTFAPMVKIEGESAQTWLQGRYIAAFRHCYRRLKNCAALAGWGVMNEPSPGFIGYKDLNRLENYAVTQGPMPGAFQSMAAASGHAVNVKAYAPWWKGPLPLGGAILNPRKLNLFKDSFTCPWKQAGIWTDDNGEVRLLKKEHFALYNGKPASFTEHFLKPFMAGFIEKMQEAGRPALYFIEGVAQGKHPSWTEADGTGVVNAFHHYDGPTLFYKRFRPWFTANPRTMKPIFGQQRAAAFWKNELAEAKAWTREQMGDMPCLLGEFGLPFDLENRKAYTTGDYSLHEEALSRYYDGVDGNLLHSTIWNYTADNTHEEGDRWNGEDLSIIYKGEGRAMGGWLRPYPMAVAGTPLFFSWDRKTRLLRFRFRTDPAVKEPTEIFAPPECFGGTAAITVCTGLRTAETGGSGIRAEYLPHERRIFIYNETCTGEAEISVRPGGKEYSA
jgi:hypothetical protein